MSIFTFFTFQQKEKAVKKPAEQNKNARRYRTDTAYVLPKDGQEEERINFQHHLLLRLLGHLYVAPLSPDITSLLDIGSGTGKWAADMAKLFPSAEVVGLDIEAPTKGLVTPPPNYRFVSGNVLENLPFPDHTFSYVHQRLLVAAIPAVKWPSVIKELARVTAPDGYVELVEGGDTYIQAGPAMQQMLQWGKVASTAAGIDASLMARLDSLLLSVGLQEVTKQELQVPVGQWGGRYGAMLATDMQAGFLGLKHFYCSTLAIAPERFDETIKALPEEWTRFQTSYVFYVTCGRKPGYEALLQRSPDQRERSQKR